MLASLKHRLARVSPDSIRYRMAHRVASEEELRKAHACTLYWVYLPVAVISFVYIPIMAATATAISWPIAWLAGYKKVGPIFPRGDRDTVAERSSDDIYRNAHVKIAPWRIFIPLAVVIALLIIGTTRLRTIEIIVLATLAVGALIGWGLWQRWGKVSDAWDHICPRLEVDRSSSGE
jgi:hypothetical protein